MRLDLWIRGECEWCPRPDVREPRLDAPRVSGVMDMLMIVLIMINKSENGEKNAVATRVVAASRPSL